MGLDMWIRRVRKPNLEDKVYTAKELDAMGYSMASVKEFEKERNMIEQLIPYTVVRKVKTDYYNVKKNDCRL